MGLEAELGVEVSADASDESLEGGTWEEVVDALLVSLDLSEGNGTGLSSELSLLLHAS